ncbi:hypothetical protein ACQEVF_43495 [Nonomuraea polychroma]
MARASLAPAARTRATVGSVTVTLTLALGRHDERLPAVGRW